MGYDAKIHREGNAYDKVILSTWIRISDDCLLHETAFNTQWIGKLVFLVAMGYLTMCMFCMKIIEI